MKKKHLSITAIIGSMVLLFAASLVFAGSVDDSAMQDAHFTNNGWVPQGSKLVLNIVHKVTNDEDSGIFGYWALDSYNRHIQVWQDHIEPTMFYAVARYDGRWQTFAGALSPGAGVPQSIDAFGTFHGGYLATFTATEMISDPDYKQFGNIGTFDYGGTEDDVLLGNYGAGQTGPATPWNWLDAYFIGSSGFTQTRWGWTYNYRSQTWNNFDYGTTGDIVV